MAQHAHAKKPNYRNIVLAGVIIVLIIVMVVLLVSALGKKKPEPAPDGSDISSVSESGSVYGSEEISNYEESSEENSSSAPSSSESSSSKPDSSSSKPESSSSKPESSSSSSSSSSEGTTTPTGKYVAMPETPYSYDTTGKTVRNAFDANGEVDLLFPINSTYYITRNFKAAKLETVDGDYKMDYRAAPHCREMLEAMRSQLNSKIRAFSTYRSYSYQEGNFQRKVDKLISKGYSKTDAYNTAATIVAIPGTSEHQLGLAIDVYIDSLYNKYGELNEHFEETDEYKWLQEHAWEYGFILSYPKDKIKDTGIIYEPWHYRYVGVENAKTIRDSGMLLVQWLESQNIVYVYNGK